MIEDYIPLGYENRITRIGLKIATGKNDRAIRDEISEAAERGVMIASLDGGYFRWRDSRDDPYFMAYMKAEDRRFKTQSHKNKLRRMAWERVHPGTKKKKDEIPGQMSFDFT